jgi:phospholipase/carboxylesterase
MQALITAAFDDAALGRLPRRMPVIREDWRRSGHMDFDDNEVAARIEAAGENDMNLLHSAYEPFGDGPHPAVVALHGWGASAMDLIGLAAHVADGRCLMLCPEGRIDVPLGPMVGHGWFPLTMGAPPDPAALQQAVDQVRRFLDAAAQRYPIATDQLVLLGFSQGGVVAYALALAEPQRFAALVALSSWLPPPLAPANSGIEHERLPTLVHHGTTDELVPIERGRASVETLRSLRVPVTYREFDMGHEINAASLSHLSAWLREKVVSPIVVP